MNSIDLEALNHWVLTKQHLTPDSRCDDVLRTVSDVGGLHATNPTTPYLSLAARSLGFARDRLDDELYVRRSLAKLRCVRTTIYVLTREMIPAAYAATSSLARRASAAYMQFRGVLPETYAQLSRRILDLLKGEEMTAAGLRSRLNAQADVSAVINLMCDEGLLIRGRPARSWRDRSQFYAPFAGYFPDVRLDRMCEAEATTHLVRQYLGSFGPATMSDVVWWTGFTTARVRAALNALAGQLDQVRVAGLAGDLLLLRSEASLAAEGAPPGPPAVNLLPTLDPYLMGYRERARWLDERHREWIFDRGGNATSTILIDGRAVGVWDSAQDGEACVKLYLFEEPEKAARERLETEARRMGEFMLDQAVRVRRCERMVPLSQRTAGGVMAPLKGC